MRFARDKEMEHCDSESLPMCVPRSAKKMFPNWIKGNVDVLQVPRLLFGKVETSPPENGRSQCRPASDASQRLPHTHGRKNLTSEVRVVTTEGTLDDIILGLGVAYGGQASNDAFPFFVTFAGAWLLLLGIVGKTKKS